MFGRH